MAPVERSFAFGRYRLFVRTRQLFAGDAAVHIGSRAFDILAVLVEAGGNIVSKNEIMRRVWGNIVVEENTLQSQVHALRRALGPDRGLVANVSGRGYRIAINIRVLAGDKADRLGPDQKDIDRSAEVCAVNERRTLTNVGASVSPLIGRSHELELTLRLIQARRLVTVTGIGGIGKTRLAMEIGRASVLRFADGVWLADLAQVREPDLLGATVLTCMGLHPQSSDITPEHVAAALASKRALLILDTCERLGEIVGSFAQCLLQGAPYLNVLATSRQPLGAEGEQVYQIPPLKTPDDPVDRADEVLRYDAAQLFEARVKELDPQFRVTDGNADSVARICRRLDGIPLAIELAAPRVAALGPETIACRLDQLFQLLSRGRAAAHPRHQTLRATLDWSYKLLPEDERAMFGRLAVFSGGFSLEAVCAVVSDATCSESDVVDRLDRLIAKSLVVIDQREVPRRFRLLHPVADYAMEKLTEYGQVQELRRRHAEFYLKAYQERPGDERDKDSRLASWRADLGNIRVALGWSLDGGDPAIGIGLAVESAPVWLRLSLLTDGVRWTEKALAQLATLERLHSRDAMILHYTLGSALVIVGVCQERTVSSLEKAVQLAQELRDMSYELRGLHARWLMMIREVDIQGALRLTQRLEAIAQAAESPEAQLSARRNTAITLYYGGQYAEASSRLEQVIKDEVGSLGTADGRRLLVSDQTISLGTLANIRWLQGFPDQARTLGQRAIDQARAEGNTVALCHALIAGGVVIALKNGDLDAAEKCNKELLQRAHELSSDVYRSFAFTAKAVLTAANACSEVSLEILEAAQRLLRRTNHLGFYCVFADDIAWTLAKCGRLHQASAVVDEVLGMLGRRGSEWQRPELLRVKGELELLERGAAAALAAGRLFRQSLEIAHDQRALGLLLRTGCSFARLLDQQGRRNEAVAILAPIYDQFTEGFDTTDLLRARSQLAYMR